MNALARLLPVDAPDQAPYDAAMDGDMAGLWCAVIRRTLADAMGNVMGCDGADSAAGVGRIVASAKRWFERGGADFRRVCWLAGLDPNWVRPRALALIYGTPPAGCGAPDLGRKSGTSLGQTAGGDGRTASATPGPFPAGLPFVEPDWGDLQEAYRIMRAHGCSLWRKTLPNRRVAIYVDGTRTTPAKMREWAARMQAGTAYFQRGRK